MLNENPRERIEISWIDCKNTNKTKPLIVFTIVAVFLVLLLTTPIELYIGDIAIDYKELPRIRRMIEKKPYTD